jgi:shikimate kinase
MRVKRILLTGISGTGKSTTTNALAARGYKSVDLDGYEYSEWVDVDDDADVPGTPVEPNRDWVWREDRVQELLSAENVTGDAGILFVSGCAMNMGKFIPQFDHVILLSAAAAVIVERLATRTNNDYGKHPDEVARVLELMESVEPLLRRRAHHEIDTSVSLDEVVTTILRLTGTG